MNSTLYLTPTAVKQALVAIQQSKAIPAPNPLLRFGVVSRKFTTLPEHVCGQYAELYAVKEVITESLTNAFERERLQIHHKQAICQAFTLHNVYIEAYIAVFCCYVRPDIGLDSCSLGKMVGYCYKTINRRLLLGINHLTLDLLEREIALSRTKTSVDHFSRHSDQGCP